MRVSQVLSALPQVKQAMVAMGTDANKRVLAEIGLLTPEAETADANDLVIVVEAASDDNARAALAQADQILLASDRAAHGDSPQETQPQTQEQARRQLADANLALISVPGAYAALEAAKALQAGLHVFLFSDNVTREEELALKKLAVAKGLLMMGPGCGTAVVNGVALAFANVLKRGPVGVVGASGTGLQELTALVDRGGVGISQAIGVGGRDLSEGIGGLMMLQGLAMLAADPDTELIAVISKPPHPSVTPKILEAARAAGKPVIVNFLGNPQAGVKDGLEFTTTIENTAEVILRRISGEDKNYYTLTEDECQRLARRERRELKPGQKYLRGLFSGGSLCDEAMEILITQLGGVYSNIPLSPEWALEDAWRSKGHCCVDMGEEEFTRGRPHPMIDTRLRQERILKEADDPETAAILLDVVIGYGAHDDPAGALGESIRAVKAKAKAEGRYLSVVAHVCGTAQDPQGLDTQEQKLRDAGALVMPTNAQAARLAAALMR
jgi:succinyl-CoA synthetase alpha subunit